jgi:glycosidase
MGKVIIYQVFTRLFGNRNTTNKRSGTITENGCGKMDDFTINVLKEISDMGVSHIWYTGLIRHASLTDYSSFGIPKSHKAIVKGIAGSPYAIADYYDIDPDIAQDVNKRMSEFESLVKRTHKANLKMIIDFVPNHVARQYHSIKKPKNVSDLGADDDTSLGFSPNNNFYYCPGVELEPLFDNIQGESEPYKENPAKATGNNRFDNHPEKNDWYETVKLNYGIDYSGWNSTHFSPIPNTWLKMLDILLFWASKGVDGFRCDMAEMVPVDFWHWLTDRVKVRYPKLIFIGEVYNPNEYRNYISYGGFDYLYDKVGMYDTLRAIICNSAPASSITEAWQTVDDIREHMLYFLENHDEQRIASVFFANDSIKAIPALIVSLLLQKNPFMLYAGQEFGEKGMDEEGFSGKDGRTTIFDYWSLDSFCRRDSGNLSDSEKSLWTIYNRLMHIASKEKSVTDGKCFDLMYVNHESKWFNPNKQYAFLRQQNNEMLLVVVNFDNNDVNIKVKIPQHAFEYLQIDVDRNNHVPATDLLTGETISFSLYHECEIPLDVKHNGGRVYKLKIKNGNR